jgi:hypothetical protein
MQQFISQNLMLVLFAINDTTAAYKKALWSSGSV